MTGECMPNGAVLDKNAYRTRNMGRTPLEFGFLLLILDIVALAIAAWLAGGVTHIVQTILKTPALSASYVFNDRQNIYIFLSFIVMTLLWSKGLYTQRVPWWSQVQYIGKVIFLAFLLDGFINFGLLINESRLLIAATWILAFGLIVPFRWVACQTAARMGWWKIPTVIIADNSTVTDLIYAFHADPCAGYDVNTVFLRDRDRGEFDVTNLPASCRHVQIRDGMMEYETYIRENPDHFYVVSLDAFRGETRDSLINTMDDLSVSYAIVPSITRIGLYEMEPRYFFGHDVMMLQARSQTNLASVSLSRAIKRAMDITASGLALALLSPLLIGVVVMLKVEGQGGTPFYGGKRIGRNGNKFSCWKFRSMEPDSDHLLHAYLAQDEKIKADWEKYRKLPNDPRVTTRTARFIRKASIDELPQLWNVLVGDMSLVGPRPILQDEVPYFGDALKEYLSVRPGLTGLWQVSGRNATSFMRRVYWDSWYVRNWSLWGDIVILIKTPLVLLSRKGAS